jgi:hypothetical protein
MSTPVGEPGQRNPPAPIAQQRVDGGTPCSKVGPTGAGPAALVAVAQPIAESGEPIARLDHTDPDRQAWRGRPEPRVAGDVGLDALVTMPA